MFDLDNLDKPVDTSAGEWVDNIPNHPGARFKVRSKSFKPFDVAHNRLLRSFGKRAVQAIETDEYQQAAGQLIADHLLIGWENAVTVGGKPAPYDKKLAAKLLTSVDTRGIGDSFRDAVLWAASAVADRHLGLVEDISGN